MHQIIHALEEGLNSEVRYDQISKQLYSTDASMYQIEPVAIVIPRNKSELILAIEIASHYDVPIIARGAATGVIGGCLGKGLIIDCSQHLSRIVEINYEKCFAIVQPGCVLDQLNGVLASHGLCFGPDTSTSNRATIGGMVSTNASGSYSLVYGTTQDHVLEIEMILWNGEVIRFERLDKDTLKAKLHLDSTEGKIYRSLEQIKNKFGGDIANHFPHIHRKASGYSLDLLIQKDFDNVSKLICGSEGTLGIISEIKLALCPLLKQKTMVIIGTKNLLTTLKDVQEILAFSPIALEIIDRKIIEAGKSSPLIQNRLSFLEGTPEALLIIECSPEHSRALLSFAQKSTNAIFIKKIEDKMVQKAVWELRKTGLGLLLSKRSYSRSIAFIEDIIVPIDKIFPFITEIEQLLLSKGKEAGIYGHLGAGCLHIRPYFDTRNPEELKMIEELMQEAISLVLKYKGILSSEHGDGLARTWTNSTLFTPRLYEAFSDFKHAFDPYDRMNSKKIVSKEPQGLLENLKLSPTTVTKEITTYLDFSREGGFALAVDMCNGNGACRKKEGVMCPSYQVTHDEKDSTRARANALQGLIHGQINKEEIASFEFQGVMELCIQCKGCKTECPSQVDMAKLKSEWQHQVHKKKRPSVRDRLFGSLSSLFFIGSYTPRLVNWLSSNSLFRKILGSVGISEDRPLPRLAASRFSTSFRKGHLQDTKEQKNRPKVVLFIDSFTEFLTPSIGMAAVEIFEALGFSVIAPEWHCCGRPLISKGFLPEAKKKLRRLVDHLYPYAKKGLKIVGLEPSCILTLVDEIRDFGLDQEKVNTVREATLTIDQFLLSHIDKLVTLVKPYSGTVKIHGHCHQKALVGMQAELMLLKRLTTKEVIEIPSGCCGMAGSFGYEKEHSLFSQKIGNLVLFPHITASDDQTIIIASGTSCRAQIEDGTEKKPMHLIEFIKYIQNNSN